MLLLVSVATATALHPGDDWCAAVNAASAGDELVMDPGDYDGPCTLSTSGADGAPIVLRAADPADPPRIVYEGASDNVINVQASWVTLSGLAIGPTQPDIDGVKVKSGDHVTVEGCTFTGVAGIGVSANSVDTTGLVIEGNTFRDMQATAIYVGCHDGSCVAGDVRIAGNLIDGVVSPDVGYGVELKRDSWGEIRDNVVAETQGPGIEVFGSEDPTHAVVVDGNFVVHAQDNAEIEVGGPYVTVTSNVVVGQVYVYAYWDSVQDVVVAGNTVIADGDAAFVAAAETTASRFVDNAAFPATEVFPLDGGGNVACDEACWVDVAGWDLGLPAGSALAGAGVDDEALATDFCGAARGSPPSAGAFEGEAGALEVALKEGWCPEAEEEDTGGKESETGCGCASGGGVGGWWVGAGILGWRRRDGRMPTSARRAPGSARRRARRRWDSRR